MNIKGSLNMKKRTALYALLTSIMLVAVTLAHAVEPTTTRRITLLHVNDFHGHLSPLVDRTIDPHAKVGGATYLAGLIHEERQKNPRGTLLLSAGDMFQGTPVSNLFYGQPVVEIMNHLKFDAMVLGNHEFDWGRDVLQNLVDQARFPILSSNVSLKNGRPIPGIKPYVIFEREGIKLGILGLTTQETQYAVKATLVEDIDFRDPIDVTHLWVNELKAKGADIIVVLSHLGLPADRKLARHNSDIHVIVGGHSHTVVKEPVVENRTIIVQAGYYGIYLGVLDLEVDEQTGRITAHSHADVLRLASSEQKAPPDKTVQTIVAKYTEKIEEKLSLVIGETRVDLVRNPMGESNLGNLICDAMRETSGTPIAFQNGGGIRMDIPAGMISLGDLYTMLPFKNRIVTIDLTGEQILEILEQSGTLQQRILQVSGLEVDYDLSRPPGDRITRAMVGESPLSIEERYRVAVNDFLAAGGDRFSTFREGYRMATEEDLLVAVQSYMERHSPVAPKIEGRIRFLGEP